MYPEPDSAYTAIIRTAYAVQFLCSVVQWPVSAEFPWYETTVKDEMDKIVSRQVQCVDPQEYHSFLWPLSR